MQNIKLFKKFKILVLFMLVVLINMNTFSAVVYGDFGPAFITKEEFDGMRADFAEQVEKYNDSIGGRIDGMLGAYIKGTTMVEQPRNLWARIMKNANNKLLWCSADLPESVDRTALQDDIKVTALRYYNHPEYNTYTAVRGHGDYSTSQGTIYQVAQTKSLAEEIEGGNEYGICRSYNRNANAPLRSNTGWVDKPWRNTNSFEANALTNSFITTKKINDGDGKLFRLNKLPNENYELKYYYKKAYFKDELDIKCYSYKNAQVRTSFNAWSPFYTIMGGMNDETSFELTFPAGTGYTGGKINDDTVVNYSSNSSWQYGLQTLSWTTESDEIDYSFRFWGTNVDQDVYAITDDIRPDWNTATEYTNYGTGTSMDDKFTYIRDYYPYTGPATEDVEVSNIKYTFKHPKVEQAHYRLKDIQNSYISTIASEQVYHGNGAPAFRVYVSDEEYEVKDFKLELYDKDGNRTSGTVRIMLSNNKFRDGDFNVNQDKIYDTTVSVPASGELTIDIPAFELLEGTEVVWVNVYPTEISTGKLVKLVSMDPKLA